MALNEKTSIVYFFNFQVAPSYWISIADKTECGGSEISKGTKKTLSDCAKTCQGLSSMFIYGTNDFGEDKCKTNGTEDCPCYCETSYNKAGECKMVENNGYRLYKYKDGKSI